MKTKTPATVEDLYKAPSKAELVDGEIALMSPTGDAPARAGLRISHSLLAYEELTGEGRTYPDNVGFIVNLPNRRSFSPDVAFYKGKPTRGVNMKFVEGAPAFAVEIRSENDYGPAADRRIAAKRADYFTAGAQVVWDVDLQSEDVISVYRAADPSRPTIYRRGETAEAEPALPGWSLPVDDLFYSPRKKI